MDYLKESGTLYEKYGEANFLCDTHELYYIKDEQSHQTKIVLYHRYKKLEIDLGYVGTNKDNTIRHIYSSNECICFFDVGDKGKTTIRYMFYIPNTTFINGEEKELEEMFYLLFGSPFKIGAEIPKPRVRYINLGKSSQEN